LAEVCEFGRERDYRYGQTGRLLVSQTTGAVQIKAGKRCGARAILLNAHQNARARLTPQASTARAPRAINVAATCVRSSSGGRSSAFHAFAEAPTNVFLRIVVTEQFLSLAEASRV
jgi:hypothetical protein